MILKPKHSAAALNIFTLMTGLAKKENAYNLSQGLPDYPIAPELGPLLAEAAEKGFNQYAPMPGLLELRENIAASFSSIYHTHDCTPEMITITPGATYAIYASLATILEKGDEVIYLEPAFDCYLPAIEMNGGIPVAIQLDESRNFEIDWQKVKDAVSSKTRAILINTPHNPTGRIWIQYDWDQLADIIETKNIFVIADEVYNTIVYDNNTHLPGFLQKKLRHTIISIYSFGKMFHITGWKVGYCIAAPAITNAFRAIHQYLSFSVNTPAQYALAMYLETTRLEEAAAILQAKRDLLIEGLADSGFIIKNRARGTYFQLYDYSSISKLPDIEFAQWLATTHKVATIPISAFYKSPTNMRLIRLSFAKKDEVIIAATQLLSKL